MKQIKKIFSTLFILLTLSSYIAAKPSVKEKITIKKGVLSNGLEYYLVPNITEQKQIIFGLYVKAGACMEDENEKGIAHFVEHCCFNETDHFKKNEFKTYIQSIGMNFGSDCNAFTNENKTIYISTIPSQNQEAVDKTITWFHDIAGNGVHFKEDECKNEKKIVLEEWRLINKTSNKSIERINKEHYLKGSKYETVEVAGTEKTIASYSSEMAKQFYNKWYRSDNIVLLITGDINSDDFEKKVQNYFSDIKKASTERKIADLSIPEQESTAFSCHAEEILAPHFFILEKIQNSNQNYEENKTNLFYYEKIISIFNNRLNQKKNNLDCPYDDVLLKIEYFKNRNNAYLSLLIKPKSNLYEESLKIIKSELIRFKKYGLTQNEYIQLKNAFTISQKNISDLHFTIDTRKLFDSLVSNIENSEPLSLPQDDYLFRINSDKKATHKLLNDKCSELFIHGGEIFEVRLPSNFKDAISAQNLFNIYKYYEPEELNKVNDKKLPSTLTERPLTKAKVISTTKDDNLDCNIYKLSNGLTLILKKTSGEPGKIKMLGESEGGLSQYGTIDFPSCLVSPEYANFSGINGYSREQVMKILSGKNFSISFGLNENSEYITSESVRDSIEYMLQFVYLLFKNPYFTNEGWNQVFNKYNELFQYHKTHPSFDDFINRNLYPNNVRHNITDNQFNSLLDQQKAEKTFRERFSNAADFTFIFAGDFIETELLNLCCYYLGSIPGNETKKEKSIDRSTPCNEHEKIIRASKGPVNTGSDVFIYYFKKTPFDDDAQKIFVKNEIGSLISNYINMKLSEKLREENYSTYTVKSKLDIFFYPSSYTCLSINFSCNSDKSDILLKLTSDCINELLTNPISDSDFNKLQSFWLQGVNTNKHYNQWWINRIENIYIQHRETSSFVKNYDIIYKEITKENIHKYINLLINSSFSEAFIFEPQTE